MKSFSPRHRVIARKLLDNGVICDLSDDVISLNVNKGYGQMSGLFQIVVTWRMVDGLRYDQILATNDIITIELAAGDGSDMEFVLVGLINRVARTGQYADGGFRRTITITGQDFGKLLKTQLGWDISGIRERMEYGTGAGKVVTAYFARYLNQQGTAKELVQWAFKMFQEQLTGAYYPQYINFKADTDDSWITFYPTMVGIRGTDAWAAMQSLANEPYNVLTTRTEKDGKFYVVLEKYPVDVRGKLTRDTFHQIDEEDVVVEDIGISDHERVNLLCYWPTLYKTVMNDVLDIALAYPELTKFSELSAKQHGFSALILKSEYVPLTFAIEEKETPLTLEKAVERAELFWNWNKNNHEYESGTFVMHGRPGIRPGDGLRHKEEEKQYLIEHVGHQYTVFPRPSYLTQVHVTRGQKD